jgi:hypothetical protein
VYLRFGSLTILFRNLQHFGGGSSTSEIVAVIILLSGAVGQRIIFLFRANAGVSSYVLVESSPD